MSPRVLVVGGGISGLVAALRLAEHHEVVLAESDTRLGGKIATTQFRGRPLDLGPDAFITRDDSATALCRELGLGDELLAPGASGAGVFVRGKLRPLPDGLVIGIPTDLGALSRSGLVSPLAAVRARADRFFPARLRLTGGADPTVASALRPRLGKGVLSALVDPLIGGINASDVASLSLSAALPQLVPALDGARSVSRALAPLRAAAASANAGPVFYGLAPGLGHLVICVAAAARALGATLLTATNVEAIGREGAGWSAQLAGRTERFDGLLLALPAHAASSLLAPVAPILADELGAIPYAGVATVTLAYPQQAVPDTIGAALGGGRGLVGNGVLIARSRERIVTAATFTSTKWPRSSVPGEVVVRASVGRHRDERALGLSDDGLLDAVRADLGTVLGIDAAPLDAVVSRWPASFPQYVAGHLARVERIEAGAAALSHFGITGAALRGIGIPACVRNAQRCAAELADTFNR